MSITAARSREIKTEGEAKAASKPARAGTEPAEEIEDLGSRMGRLAVSSEKLDRLLERFVAQHGAVRQHTAGWADAMGRTVGGSEIAALMGVNPYTTFYDVAATKLRQLSGDRAWDGGEACWWGTLFEDVFAAYVAADLGGVVRGDDICIQIVPGHRNSPDGYIVARFYQDGEDLHGAPRWRLWTSDMPPARAAFAAIVLLEFKCPLTRRPDGKVPRQYRPQIQSGLAVSVVASMGLFGEAVFRKCAYLDLGDTPAYDTLYHARDDTTYYGDAPRYPLAWGLIFVYAPRLDAPAWVRLGWRGPAWAAGDPDPDAPDADAAVAAWDMLARYQGTGADPETDFVDFGDAAPKIFTRALGVIDARRFPVVRGPPCFADGRGTPLDAGRAVAAARAAAPPHHRLLGVLPWKLLGVDYMLARREPGFLAAVRPRIDELHRLVAEARAQPDPAAHLRAACGVSPAVHGRARDVSESVLQDLFDSIAAESAAEGAAGAGVGGAAAP